MVWSQNGYGQDGLSCTPTCLMNEDDMMIDDMIMIDAVNENDVTKTATTTTHDERRGKKLAANCNRGNVISRASVCGSKKE